MRPASHAAPEVGLAAGRAAMLLGAAVLVGLLLLNATDSEGPRVATETTTDPAVTTLPGEEVPVEEVPAARPPGEVKVLSANATRVEGAAGRVTERLRLAGYDVRPPTDAPSEAATVIHFTPGYELEAQVIAETLGVPATSVQPMPTPAPVSDLREAQVLVLVGPELANPSTTTSAPAGATTTAA